MDFLRVDLPVKLSLVEHHAKSSDLVPSGWVEPLRVTKDQVPIVEVRVCIFPLFPSL